MPRVAALLALATGTAAPVDVTYSRASACLSGIDGAKMHTCILTSLAQATRYRLDNAPTGMVTQPRSGFLHRTPAPAQTGTITVQLVRTGEGAPASEPHTFIVPAALPVQAGIYVSPQGSDNAAGTLAAPQASLQRAAERAQPGDTVWMRGGRYLNPGNGTPFDTRERDNIARITVSGSADHWITLRPHGNEYPTLASDVNGIVFKDARYWRVRGLELEGAAQALSRADALDLWWDLSPLSNKIDGRGIANNSSFHIDIAEVQVNDFPGAGVSNNGGSYITLRDSVIYNNGWWTTAGTHGFANSKPVSEDPSDTTAFKIPMRGNLLYGNQSSMISRVLSKRFAKLEIDQGNGLHMQNTEEGFIGRFLVEHNLSILNGKAGLGLNTVDHGVVQRNGFYANAQAVDNAAELVLQSASPDSVTGNLFHALPQRRTIKDSSDTYPGIGANIAVASADAARLPASITFASAVFADPANADFRQASGIPAGYGPAADVLAAMRARRIEFGLTPSVAPTQIDAAYQRQVRAAIFKSWPEPVAGDQIPDNLKLEDTELGYCYRYEDKDDWPNPPQSGTNCDPPPPQPHRVAAHRASVTAAPEMVSVDAENPARPTLVRASLGNSMTLSQTSDSTPGSSGASCARHTLATRPTSWWRRFSFDDHPGTGSNTTIQRVRIATGPATPAATVLTVALYTVPRTDAQDTILPTSLTLLASASATTSASLATLTVPIRASVQDTQGNDLVVELRTSGNAAGGQFLPGANSSGETRPTFVSAEDCGILAPTPAVQLGFTGTHLPLSVVLAATADTIFSDGLEL
jgi:hypothetical protein